MTREIAVVMRKELKEIGIEGGGRRGRLTPLIALAVTGVFFPLNFGMRYVQPDVLMIMGMFLPVIFVLPLVADTFAGERERHTLETLLATRLPDRAILFGKLAAIVAYSFVLMVLALILAFVALNIAHPEARPIVAAPSLLAGMLLEGVLAASLLTGIGLLISLGATTVRQAQQRVSFVLFIPILIPFIVSRLPSSVRVSIRSLFAGRLSPMALVLALLVLLNAVILFASMRRFRRSRLIAA
jgi:ABC-2 type transport system permease protein